ncbi:tRNA pseudouridine(13) synthase TruD [Actinoplanes derwentensis]|uniref:tRNA pseudouridine13 synthase n=1 Tax=Actinoplanes derwentensis TaxID=113562 RepID=A0A1H2DDD5_9ACTN|nr:tRNA pseudouridine(13) synthase TruD [Actinoplanes derwentensis]GID89975.1 hypothetical protein Ade03nite_88990 [Actinoplanes derwentensis]SDT80594.1 tRNA pseudouridine13 synthase [Actinoplanes derwentensis]
MTPELMQVGPNGAGTAPILKYAPADFVVQESLVVDLIDGDADQHYLLLRKRGYTTMEAIRLVAEHFGLASTDVTYGGLKDEDGITQQVIAVPAGAVTGEGWRLDTDPDRSLEVLPYGAGREELQIGGLEGNAFRIVLRNLDEARATALADARKITLFYLNYYDTQRFGVPAGPKRTHLVGSAILAGDWDQALSELIGLNAPESASAAAWTGRPADFFAGLDWRTTSFYLAADASYQWNETLREVTGKAALDELFDLTVDGLEYRYVRSTEAAVAVLGTAAALPYSRHTIRDGELVTRISHRSTVVQTTIAVGASEPDDRLPGRYRVHLRFFLPSGSYATAAIRQLLGRL